MKKILLCGILVLLMSLVIAGTPTTPTTLSPVNNSIFFNQPTLTCTGSIDPNGLDVNSSFYTGGDAIISPLTSTTSDQNSGYSPCTDQYGGKTFISTNYINTYSGNSQYSGYGWRSVVYEDTWTLNISHIQAGGDASNCDSVQICINGSLHTDITSIPQYSSTIHEIDVSAYKGHNVTFSVRSRGTGGYSAWLWYKWDVPVDIGTTTLQSDSRDTYYWENITSTGVNTWWCAGCNWENCSSDTAERDITLANFTDCGFGSNTKVQHFNLLNETNSVELGNFSFDCSITLSATDSNFFNFALNGSSNYTFCATPLGVSIGLSGFCQYDTESYADYSYPRQYWFDSVNLVSGTQRNYSLYQLEDGLSTAITFTVTEAGVPLENRIIQIQRFDVGTGNYRAVSMLKTDANGQDVAYLEQTTAFYKICIFEVGNANPVHCSGSFHITSESYNVALTTSSALTWSNLVGIGHNLTFDNNSDQFELTYSDPNEKTTEFCLEVYRDRFTQRVLISNNCLSANSGTIQSLITAINGTTYSAYALATLFANTSGQYTTDTFLISQITHSYGLDQSFATNGLFFIWLLVAVFSMLAFYSPSLALLLSPLPVVFGSFSGILAVPLGTALALYVGFIILAVVVGGRK